MLCWGAMRQSSGNSHMLTSLATPKNLRILKEVFSSTKGIGCFDYRSLSNRCSSCFVMMIGTNTGFIGKENRGVLLVSVS